MNKIKKMWNENRVILVLGFIVFLCLVIILAVMVQYFFGSTSSSYGDRLSDIADTPFTDEEKAKIVEGFSSFQPIQVDVDVRGKIIYLIVQFDETVSLEDAKNVTVEVYNAIEEKYRLLYDFNATIKQDASENASGYQLMGAKNVSSGNFIWSNNTPIPENSEDSE